MAARSVGAPRTSQVVTQAWRFAAVGLVSTVAYTVLYALLRTGMAAALANAVALLATAVGNTAANRRLTFGVRGSESLGRHHLAGLMAFAVALSMTSAATALLGVVAPRASRLLELVVLSATNALATVVRFFLLRFGIARRRPPSPPSMHPERTIP